MEFDCRINDEDFLVTLELVKGISAEVFKTVLYVSGPPLIAGLVIGLVIGLFQTVTQIQEFTLTFVPKMLIVFGCIFILMPWMSEKMLSFTRNLIEQIPFYIK